MYGPHIPISLEKIRATKGSETYREISRMRLFVVFAHVIMFSSTQPSALLFPTFDSFILSILFVLTMLQSILARNAKLQTQQTR